MRVSTIQMFQNGLDSLLNRQASLSNLQVKIASGKNILQPSDDPVGATRVLSLRQLESQLSQFTRNADNAQTELQSQESILGSMTTIYQRIHELALQSSTATVTRQDREAIALEIEQNLEELVTLTNSKSANGEFIFSGTKSNSAPVVQDTQGQYHYNGNEGQRIVKIGSSTSIAVNLTAKDVFFLVDNAQSTPVTNLGLAQTGLSGSSLVAPGSLSTLDSNELILNGFAINPSAQDGLSTSDASASAKALADAINAHSDQHDVIASPQVNSVNLGTFSAGALASGDLTINGVQIVVPTGTEQDFIDNLNFNAQALGVSVSQPGGLGTDIVIESTDGRNIQIQTDGTSAANLSNFDLNSGANDRVQRAGVNLRSHNPIQVGGANPSDIGLSAGVYPLSTNTGSGSVQQISILNKDALINEDYSIVFGAGGNTFSIFNESNPNAPIDGFANVAYSPNQPIEFNGISVTIQGNPNNGDTFGVEFEQPTHQNVFNSIQSLIHSIRTAPTSEQLSYEVGVGVTNLRSAEDSILQARAQLGSSLNMIDSQTDLNETLDLFAKENISRIEDLDLTQAISELSQQSIALEAAQQSYARIQSLTLFNYLR